MNQYMAAVHPFPGVPQIECRDCEEDFQPNFTIGEDFDIDWSASSFQAMARKADASIDMELLPETAPYRHAGLQRCLKTPDRRCSIDAPIAWQSGLTDWHGKHSPLPYGLDMPHNGSSDSQWTPIDQESICSGGSTWSPRTSKSHSEADGCRNHQLSPDHDISGLGVGYASLAGPLCFPETLSYHGPGCATVISPHDLHQYPDPEDLAEDVPMRSDIHEIAISHPGSPNDAGIYVPYGRPDQVGQDDEALGPSIQDESREASIKDEEDSTMGDSLEQDDSDDNYSPRSEKRSPGHRLAHKSANSKNPSASAKRSQRAKNATNQAPKPTKIAKKSSSKSDALCPPSTRNTNTQPCPHCPLGFPSDSTLKKHVLASHTRPFICIFDGYGCSSTVGSKNEWKRHINVQHMHLETWRCDIGACAPQPCGSTEHRYALDSASGQVEGNGIVFHDFDRKDLFTQHLKRMHSPTSSAPRAEKAKYEASVEGIQKRCYRRLRDPPTETLCPYCTQHPRFESWDDRIEHVGKHLERGDFDKDMEREDVALREWLTKEGYLVWKGPAQGWRLLEDGKKRKKQGEKAVKEEEGEEDAEGDEE